MKHAFIHIVFCVIIPCAAMSQNKSNDFTSIIETIPKNITPNTKRLMTLQVKDVSKNISQLVIEAPIIACLLRFAACKQEGNRMATVIQVDEFFLEYREFQLQNGQWVPTRKSRLTRLNGSRATHLSHVDILDWGVVEAWFVSLEKIIGSNDWNLDLLNSKKGERKDFLIERYEIEATGNVKQEGGPFHSGMKAEPSALERKRINEPHATPCG